MLTHLTIKNIVLIENLNIIFQNGLCVLTGETGAGKSILLDSLGLVLGARAETNLVGRYAEQSSVTATFELSENHPALGFLKVQDIEPDMTLILRRTLTKEGRSKAYVNDQPVSIQLLKQLGEFLAEIHGQFDTQSLLNPQHHIHLLDEYAGHIDIVQKTSNHWKMWQKAQDGLIEFKNKIEKTKSDEEYYRQSLEDLDQLEPKFGEEESLVRLREKLMKRDHIISNMNEAEQGLSEIETLCASVWKSLNRIGSEGEAASQAMEKLNIELHEVLSSLSDLSSDLENNEYSLTEIDDRLFALKAQARKHGCSIDGLPNKREEIAQALNAIENQDAEFIKASKKVDETKKEFYNIAKDLSGKREKAARKLEKEIMKELPPLKLDKAQFFVSRESLEEGSEKGVDRIQFSVSTNPNSAAGLLHKVASGGEMARFMLAIKVVMASASPMTTLVFDEVDSGIGGATAAAVGQRLARLADHRQVLVVTHSPQVAAKGAHHWVVSKNKNGKTGTYIVPVENAKDRQEEIARMLAGADITKEARAAAGKLLEEKAA